MNDRDEILKAISIAEAQMARLEQSREATAQILQKLRSKLATIDEPSTSQTVNHSFTKFASPEDKLRLFADLFRGREDVFARLWESKRTGKKGYSPVCEFEWQPGICTKPEKKCTNCKYVPLSLEALRGHLEGNHTLGIYPLRQDETCYFLAVDFDKSNWQADAAAFLEVCKSMQVPASLERSRSGNGGHVWIFFAEPVPAVLARNMGSYLLTETMSRHHQLSMESYDRLFPNQDTMPKGGFGNLIALPLQKEARRLGNTEFLDAQFQPYPDQWAYLASVQKMTLQQVQSLANVAAKRNRITGVAFTSSDEDEERWVPIPKYKKPLLINRDQLPARVKVTIANQLFVDKEGLPSALLAEIKRLASFQNPKFYEAQRLRLSTFRIPRIISCAEEFPKHMAIPRGCLESLRSLLEPYRISLEIVDEQFSGVPIEVDFHGALTEVQKDAAVQLLEHDSGVFVAPPGMGKTVIGIYLIAQRKLPTLILVHRRPLLQQWHAQVAEFLNLDPQAIGMIGGGQSSRTGRIDVAMLQSLVRKGEVNPLVKEYGHVVIDECHHVPAFSFEQVLKTAQPRHVIGLTATPYRRDGHHPIIGMQCGPVRYQIQLKGAALPLFKRRLILRTSGFILPDNGQLTHHELLNAMAADENRNKLILADVIQALKEKRSPIILTERRRHLEVLREMLEQTVQHLIILHGGKSDKERQEVQEELERIPPEEDRVILATGSYVGEGFDDSRLDTLFLALPISFKGKVEQYVGRILRPRPGKEETRIYDYLDPGVPVLARMFKRRLKTYRKLGFKKDEEETIKKPLAKAGLSQMELRMTG